MQSNRTSVFSKWLRLTLAPALIFIIIMAVAYSLRQISLYSIDSNIEQATRENCYKVINLLQANLRERITSLRQVANLFKIPEGPSERQFRNQGRFLMTRSPDIIAVAHINAQFDPIWVDSLEGITPTEIAQMTRDPVMAIAFERAITTRDYSITGKMTLPRKGAGFALIVPLEKEGKIESFFCGFFQHTALLGNLLMPELRSGFDIELRQADQRVYDSFLFSADSRGYRMPAREGEMRTVEDFFFVGPQMWAVKVHSTGLNFSSPIYLTSDMVSILGALLAFLVSLFVFHQQWRLTRFQNEAWVSQNQLASAGLSLSEIQENFDLILNNVNESVVLYDDEWQPIQANIAFKKAFSTPDLDLFEKPDEHHQRMAAQFKSPEHYWSLINGIKDEPERPLSDEIEFTGGGPGSKPKFYQRWATTVCRPDGSRHGYLIIYQDITPAKNVEQLKDDFLASVTHDLRTPLASIRGFAETMLRDAKMDEATRDEFATIIRDEAKRLGEMIEDLLDLRRMEAGRFDLAPSAFRMKTLVEDVLRAFRPIFAANGLKVEVTWEGDETRPLFGDVGKIGRALRNIVSNAIKYAPGGTTLRIRGVESADSVELEIADEGNGIPVDDLPYVFEKFYRGSAHVRRTKGTGLGLAIVKHIVEGHGGDVSARNGEPTGAIIKIRLPRVLAARKAETPPNNANGIVTPANGSKVPQVAVDSTNG